MQDLEEDLEDDLALETAQSALASGSEAFESADYHTADADLKEALSLVQELPVKLRRTCDISQLRFRLAVCAFHIYDPETAETILISVVGQQTRTKTEALNLCYAGDLLAQVYTKQGKLDLARTSCENTLRGRRKLLGKEDISCYESLALLSRIHELDGQKSRARIFLNMIPKNVQETVTGPLRSLSVTQPRTQAGGGRVSISTTDTSEHADERSPSFPFETSPSDRSIINPPPPTSHLLSNQPRRNTVPVMPVSLDRGLELGRTSTTSPPARLPRFTWRQPRKSFDPSEGVPLHRTTSIPSPSSTPGPLARQPSQDSDSIQWAKVKVLQGHEERVSSVEFSPNGKLIASASFDKSIRIWNPMTGLEVNRLRGHSAYVRDISFSSDGKWVASASDDHTIRLWDISSGAEVQRLVGHLDWVKAVAFSFDGTMIASGSSDTTVRLWNAITGEEAMRLEGHFNSVNAVTFSPDGSRLTSGSNDKSIRIWDPATGAVLRKLDGHLGFVNTVAFSPDGNRLASGSVDGTIRIWDPLTGAEVQRFKGQTSYDAVAFSPDGSRLASGSVDGKITLWDSLTGAKLKQLKGHSGFVLAVAFSPNGKLLASGSFDETARLWEVNTV